MYEFVRRQQEQQPHMFSNKTFQWMENNPRETSWVKLYTRSMTDPLARSSSSLFPEPNRAMQRSTGKLFTFRRHRQSSETQPLAAGNSGTRRRGFTMPSSEPPQLAYQRERGATVAGEEDGPPYRANGVNNAEELSGSNVKHEAGTEWPIRAIMPQRPAQQSENSREQSAPFSSSFAAAQHSSFSPPGSPPRRTICYRARLLMSKLRGKKQGTIQPPLDSHRSPPPFSMSSALCTTKPASRADPPASYGPVAQPGPQQSRVFPPPRQPRVLPRSPLANPLVLTADEAPVDSAAQVSDESSSEEDRKCQVCAQYRAAEWTVECDSGHVLCFGCVQAHVRKLLTNSTAWQVPCPTECTASVSIRQLHACLPPRRVQQLLDNRKSKASLHRSLSVSVKPSQPCIDDGFDAPLAPQPVDAGEANVERFSASMPVLNAHSSSGGPSGPMLSELTSVEPGSVDSLVLAASAAADSSQTLSPQLLGSRLRRVPQALSPPTCPASPDHEPARDFVQHSVSPQVEPKLPPAAFKASATWITPSQRYSGFAENLLLNATLFETIRRSSIDDVSELPFSSAPSAAQRMPIPQSVISQNDDDDGGVYIPTWRKPSGPNLLPSISDEDQYESQSGVLCEAAELNFYLYETLHRRHV
ncbi:hypothetical protein LPJ78_001327 [Coemansia sp. RSA 989]|nr:hypothetical protein LPJ78_001327 [Coemansia sp. RSA 989]